MAPAHHRRLAFLATAALVFAGASAGAGPAGAAPPTPSPAATSGPDGHGPRDKDNRVGAVLPDAQQRVRASTIDPAVRWNALGTPVALGPVGTAVATGLPADPQAAARAYLEANQDLYGLDGPAVAAMDRLLVAPIGAGTVVLLRQRFGDLPAGYDGQVAILVQDGTVVHVSSSLSRSTSAPQPATLSADDAFAAALADAGLTTDQVAGHEATLVAVPTPADGPRAAYAVTFSSTNLDEPTAFTTYVDARTGAVLVREDLVDFDSDNPHWAAFESTPLAGPRVTWCLTAAAGCAHTVSDPASGQAWDVDLATGLPTFTSNGNSARDVLNWGGGNPQTLATAAPDRNYTYPLTDQWHAAQCNPDVFASAQRNDADAAIANLFAMHNRMHDFAYRLGFTEAAWNLQAVNIAPGGLGGDAEQGRAQAGAVSGSRNNANQGTPRDGLQPTTNMFLWQPVAGGAYPPCVDGDYDMTVIGHEYTHAITNRMIAGPNSGIGSFQGGSMGESWSDLVAAEYLYEYGFRPPGDTPFVTGGYVTGNLDVGIRDYDMSRSPLNFSDVAFDLTGAEVHADGEIWNATQMRVRDAFVKRYGLGTPALQAQCADGAVPVASCPGNRRWIQLMFDSFLLQAASQVSMLDMRDNMLAADMTRFGGANQDILWDAFAESGMGRDAVSGPADVDPTPSFASPLADNATVKLFPIGESHDAVVRLYVGDYEARAVPVADTDPATPLGDTFQIVPGHRFDFLAVGNGVGHHRFTASFRPGIFNPPLFVNVPDNLASTAAGATVTGDGVNLDKVVDETEATDWASLTGVAGKQITVDLAGGIQLVQDVNVSAMLRPAIAGDADPGGQNRFTALRSFELQACVAFLHDCTSADDFHTVFVSAPDAFPAGAFRPTAGQLIMRTFHIHPTVATHLRLVVLSSQCTGNPLYAGEQDQDPRASTDCATASANAPIVRISEFQAFRN